MMMQNTSRPTKIAKARPSQAGTGSQQLTLPGLFANTPAPTKAIRKLQFGLGTQLTMPQALRQLEAAAALGEGQGDPDAAEGLETPHEGLETPSAMDMQLDE